MVSEKKLKDVNGNLVTPENLNYSRWLKNDIHTEILIDIAALEPNLKAIKELDDSDYKKHGWNKGTHKENKKTWYRPCPGLPTLDVACECIVKSHIFNPLSLFAEVDLYSTWMPRIDYCHVEKSYSRFRKIVHTEVNFPWPFNDRAGIMMGYGTPLPEQNAVIVVLRTLDNMTEYLDCKFPELRNPSTVRLSVTCGCLYFRYIDENTTLFRGIFNTDPHMSLIPNWLLNFAVKKVIYALLGIIQEKSLKFAGTEIEKRVKENTYLYDEIRRRLKFVVKKEDKKSIEF